ncbi:unnamed protein product [Rotaria sordida]|uniref:Uncharacterized protein n=1 Tax=Rotaria sordida TaxID=392033 RepID=A0A818M7B0_9BILA|nr:unnamed protein product [Rotaria sordida]CAF3586360.1 unnamed protein product [Rotaria sordida]
MENENDDQKDTSESVHLSKEEEQQTKSYGKKLKTKRHSSLSISLSSKNDNEEISTLSLHSSSQSMSHVIYFGCEQHSGNELWDTSYFLSLLFELLDEFKDNSNEESRLTAFIICRLNEINLHSQIPIKLVVQILKYFHNVRLKILVLLELLNICETIDCTQGLMLLWEFSSYGYMILFYVLDRIKFSIIDKDMEWKSLLTIFEPLENKKHAAYIVLDKTNFYKPNKAIIVFGSKKLERYF